MSRKQACVLFLLAGLLIGGCQSAPVPAARATVAWDDTATEVALFGLVSWANRPDPNDANQLQLFALMPATTAEPQCLGDQTPPPMRHYPVLKIVTGDHAWNSGNALPMFQGQPRIFSIAGQDVTIVDNTFDPLTMRGFHLLSSDTTLGSTRSTTYTGPYREVDLDPNLLAGLGNGDPRLATRVIFTRGAVTAKISEYCPSPYEPNEYLAEANTIGAGPPKTGCPIDEGIDPTKLAEEVVARMYASGKSLTLQFHEWATNTDRVLVVRPAAAGEGVRVELSHQMEDPAAEGDSRADNAVMCIKDNLHDYLWYYDLRKSPQAGCADLDPAYFPCYDVNVGGTKCPEHNWGP